MTEEKIQKRDEIAVVGLISTGHFFSHFYILAIPPLLPFIRAEMDVSFLMIGLVMAIFAGCSAVGQYPMGVLADKFGARYFVIGGLFFEALAVGLMAFAPNVGVLIALAAVAGIADSVFHPADYAVITARVRNEWLGKSYAIHTFAGFLGFAAAPTLMFVLLTQFDWRGSILIAGLLGIAWAAVQFLQRSRLGQEKLALAGSQPARKAPEGPKVGVTTFLASTPIMLMFFFYVATALAGNGIQNFANSALISIYDLTVQASNLGLAGYLWGIAAGVLAGGIVADRLSRFDLISLVGYLVSATILCLIAFAVMPFAGVLIGLFFAGFMIGAVMPSRDLMVKAVTPPGAAGKAFGFVSTGFGIGGFIGPLLYGTIMDSGAPAGIFLTSALLMIVTIGFAIAAGRYVRPGAIPQPAE